MSSSSTGKSGGDDPLSIVLGPTDLSDIDSALEDLLNEGMNSDGMEAIGFDDDDDDTVDVDADLSELNITDSLSTKALLSTSNDDAPPTPAPTPSVSVENLNSANISAVLDGSDVSFAPIATHPLASLTHNNANIVENNKTNTNTNNSAVDAIKSFQASVPSMSSVTASVPSMSSVTSSITQLWNQSKPQFGGSIISNNSSSFGINSIPASYSIGSQVTHAFHLNDASGTASNVNRRLASQSQQIITNSSTIAVIPPNLSQEQQQQQQQQQLQPPPEIPKTSGGIADLVLSQIGSPLIDGERIVMFLSHVKRVSQSSFPIPSRDGSWWCCAMTLYRIILFPFNDASNQTANQGGTKKYMGGGEWMFQQDREAKGRFIQMPLASLDRIEKMEENLEGGLSDSGLPPGQTWTLVLHGKDNNRYVRFSTSTVADAIRAHQTLNTYAFPGRRNLGYLFAFESRRSEVQSNTTALSPTKRRYQFSQEFEERLKVIPSIYYAKAENSDYAICGSYPLDLIVPRICGDGSMEGKKILRKCAMFRSEQRLPVLTWARGSRAGIWRCSQPKVGIQGNRSPEDERYLRLMGEGIDVRRGSGLSWSDRFELTGGDEGIENIEHLLINGNSGISVRILDMRSKTSAMGNRGTGYGYETASHYPSTSLAFCNITNIHGVRDAYNKISQLGLSANVSDAHWGTLVEETKWLYHIRLIIQASWVTAFHIHFHNLPVLVHCSHGWDRTSQVSALAQVFLDPYYRTFDGFATLVDKEFCAFGHLFHTRAGHGEGKGDRGNNGGGHGGEGQVSPIFIQFLDSVWQLVKQFPNAFEFNLRYLLVISEHVYSCRFGTFLCDNERERENDAKLRQRTYCLWDYLDSCKKYLVNDFFEHENSGKILLPPLPLLLRNVTLWADRHLRWSPKPSWMGVGRHMEEFMIPIHEILVNDESDAETAKTVDRSIADKNDIMSMRCASDKALSELRKERLEKEKWQRIAKMLEQKVAELEK